jgi:HEAT repeat protein
MVAFATVFVIAVSGPPASAAGQGATSASARESDLRGAVDALLRSRDGPISTQRWRTLGRDAVPILEEIALDPAALPTRRARALEGVVALGSPRAPALMTQLAQDGDQPFVVRLSAVRGAGRTLSPSRRLPALRPVLERASDAHLRAAAADALAAHPSGCVAVRGQASREPAELRPKFESALRRCSQR